MEQSNNPTRVAPARLKAGGDIQASFSGNQFFAATKFPEVKAPFIEGDGLYTAVSILADCAAGAYRMVQVEREEASGLSNVSIRSKDGFENKIVTFGTNHFRLQGPIRRFVAGDEEQAPPTETARQAAAPAADAPAVEAPAGEHPDASAVTADAAPEQDEAAAAAESQPAASHTPAPAEQPGAEPAPAPVAEAEVAAAPAAAAETPQVQEEAAPETAAVHTDSAHTTTGHEPASAAATPEAEAAPVATTPHPDAPETAAAAEDDAGGAAAASHGDEPRQDAAAAAPPTEVQAAPAPPPPAAASVTTAAQGTPAKAEPALEPRSYEWEETLVRLVITLRPGDGSLLGRPIILAGQTYDDNPVVAVSSESECTGWPPPVLALFHQLQRELPVRKSAFEDRKRVADEAKRLEEEKAARDRLKAQSKKPAPAAQSKAKHGAKPTTSAAPKAAAAQPAAPLLEAAPSSNDGAAADTKLPMPPPAPAGPQQGALGF